LLELECEHSHALLVGDTPLAVAEACVIVQADVYDASASPGAQGLRDRAAALRRKAEENARGEATAAEEVGITVPRHRPQLRILQLRSLFRVPSPP
jgi:hypothetical protein